MSKCTINSCKSRRNWKSTISYFRIPAVITNQCDRTKELSSLRRQKWFEIINREDVNEQTANPTTVVCGLHFISGKPAKLFDVSNPDWVPTQRLDDNDEKVTVQDNSQQHLLFVTTEPYNDKHSVQCQTELSMCDIVALEKDNLCLREELYAVRQKHLFEFNESFERNDEGVK